jgi:plasmid stabilization system protein ParE
MQELEFHPAADREVTEAAEFFETQRTGLGSGFVDEFEAGLRQIQRHPFMWRRVRGELRRYLLRRFPYGIIYHASAERIFVLVVMHLSREPDYWLGRIADIPRAK